MEKWVIGVDEVGRGPLAGPVAVGVVLVPSEFYWGLLPGVTDSKKLSEQQREEIFAVARRLKDAGHLDYAVAMVSAPVIDRIGIVSAINLAIHRAVTKVTTKGFSKGRPREASRGRPLETMEMVNVDTVLVKLDGGLRAPEHFVHQETIIKGDLKEPVIGLASIIAKVTRDRHMVRLATRAELEPYTFHIHKGYGTKAHRAAIKAHGLTTVHRTTFCKNINIKLS